VSSPTNQHLIFTGLIPFLTHNQQCQSTEGKKSFKHRISRSKSVPGFVSPVLTSLETTVEGTPPVFKFCNPIIIIIIIIINHQSSSSSSIINHHQQQQH